MSAVLGGEASQRMNDSLKCLQKRQETQSSLKEKIRACQQVAVTQVLTHTLFDNCDRRKVTNNTHDVTEFFIDVT